MARAGIMKTTTLLSRHVQPAERRCVSKLPGLNQAIKLMGSTEVEKRDGSSSCWVPHPRSGIYFPAGHERVMEDVPDGAASFKQTYWLRSIDGVDKPDPDQNSTDFYFDTKL